MVNRLVGAEHLFRFRMDHKSLEHVQMSKWLKPCGHFTRFNFTLSFKLSSTNVKPETLSCQFYSDGVNAASTNKFPLLAVSLVLLYGMLNLR